LVAGLAIAAAVGIVVLTHGGREKASGGGGALARELGLPAKHQCGKDTEVFRAPGGREETRVFALTTTWHWVRKCLDDLLAVTAEAAPDSPLHGFLEQQVLYVLSQRPVRLYRAADGERLRLRELVVDGRIDFDRIDRVVYANKNGVAHNAMSQAALGTWLLEAKRMLAERGIEGERADRYEALGIATLEVILDPVSAGGLSDTRPCENAAGHTCSWYHAVTDRTRESPAEGGTLNKHLIVINGLERTAVALEAIDAATGEAARGDQARRYRDAADAGLYQLVYAAGHTAAGRSPNLMDYVARDAAGAPIARSWLYYSLNPARDRPGYFLKKNFKNCHYHITDMRLLREALVGAGSDADLSGFRDSRADLGTSITAFIVDTFEAKRAEGLFTDAPTTAPGNWAGCRAEMFSEETTAEIVSGLNALATAP
jgi:hypothetical protein